MGKNVIKTIGNIKKDVDNINKKNERIAIIKKKQLISELCAKTKEYPVIAVLNLNNLPDDLLQSIKKNLREKDGTIIKVSKLIVLKKVLQNIGLTNEASNIVNPSALILTNQSVYGLINFFRKNRKKVAAKARQVAPYEIIVPAGDTALPPGPALSELKTAGINVMIKAGKISVNKDSIIAKQGETITAGKAKALQMLGIFPFEVGAEIVFAYDGKYLYGGELLSFDNEMFRQNLAHAFCDAKNAAINANYYSYNSIAQLLTQAIRQGMAISGINK
ncbi:MAG: 50S ribosomal protein L10 [Candidatus Micrarchaeota archaeon]